MTGLQEALRDTLQSGVDGYIPSLRRLKNLATPLSPDEHAEVKAAYEAGDTRKAQRIILGSLLEKWR